MLQVVRVAGVIALVIAAPMLLVWGGGAFVTWDAGWAFATTDDRVLFLGLVVLTLAFAAGIVFAP